MPRTPEAKQRLGRYVVNYYGDEAEMDSQSRLLIPQVLRDKAGIKGDVSVLGMTNFLEVSTSERAQQRAEREFSQAELDRLAGMGI